MATCIVLHDHEPKIEFLKTGRTFNRRLESHDKQCLLPSSPSQTTQLRCCVSSRWKNSTEATLAIT